jgi:hypothetical protein
MGKKKVPVKTSPSGKKSKMFGVPIEQSTGMPNEHAGKLLITQVMYCLPEEMRNQATYIEAALSMLQGIKPVDELEGMLAAQMAAVHLISMNMAGRCMIEGQTVDGVNSCVNRITKLTRTFTNQMEALQRYRGKGKQTIQVQHVQVNEGGQAVVGNVQGGGGRE